MKVREIQNCPGCDSNRLKFTPGDGTPHHGRLICGECGRFITWTAKALAEFLSRFQEGDDNAEDQQDLAFVGH